MSELKTLKDLYPEGFKVVRIDFLKKEAIKWVKFIRKLRKRSEPLKALYIDGQVNFIIQFFNLTKEDLK